MRGGWKLGVDNAQNPFLGVGQYRRWFAWRPVNTWNCGWQWFSFVYYRPTLNYGWQYMK